MRYAHFGRLNSRGLKNLYIILAVCMAALVLSLLIIFIYQNKQQPDLNNVNTIISRAGNIYVLPTNETPALATVTDNSKISSSFAGKVENGDKILIYQNNRKAIVYRPGINKIVDVEPVQLDPVEPVK